MRCRYGVKLQVSRIGKEVCVERVRVVAVGSCEPEAVAGQLRSGTFEDQIVYSVRLVAGDRCTCGLKSSDLLPIAGTSDRGDQIPAVVAIRFVNCYKRSARRDADSGVAPLPD
jgi:hypothetical protein